MGGDRAGDYKWMYLCRQLPQSGYRAGLETERFGRETLREYASVLTGDDNKIAAGEHKATNSQLLGGKMPCSEILSFLVPFFCGR